MKHRFAPLAVLIAMTASAAGAAEDTLAVLSKALDPMIEAHRGDVAVKLKHLPSGAEYAYEADRPMPTASLIKLPVMIAAYEAAAAGRLSLDDRVVLQEEDKVPGSGVLTAHFSAGTEMSLRDAVRLMIAYSDNTATNLVARAVGIERVNALMDRLAAPETRLNAFVYRRDTSVAPKRSERFGLGSTTAAETVALVERLVAGEPFGADSRAGYGKADAAAVAAMCEEMMNHLRACDHDETVPSGLPEGVVVAHKTGAVSAARTDAGVIESPAGPIAYCVLTAKNVDKSWGPDCEAYTLMSQVGRVAYEHFLAPGAGVEAPRVARVLRIGADGDLVEALQRTINDRLEKGPKLGVDGDFGPNTERGVMRFQESVGLEPTGEVGPETWKALGALIMEDDPAPPPAEVNAELLPRRPQDPLTGPPVTTCPAWIVCDGATGERLFGHDDSAVRDPASTTKIMTAYIVTSLAERDPAVLDEVVTFSERADNTTGSTAGVNAGELVSVGELLYGLMLPSGNDASVALAEQFGGRLPGEDGATAYERFVAAMNATAAEVGMTNTGYRNPHGLTDEGHVTTAADLAKLAHAAMKQEVFREVVATRRRGVTLGSVDGYERNVVWRNTDRLLNFDGFYGVKTGTTGPAGACLVSAGERGGKPLIVVVLGATSGDARYVDARNLYRWAWKELGVE